MQMSESMIRPEARIPVVASSDVVVVGGGRPESRPPSRRPATGPG